MKHGFVITGKYKLKTLAVLTIATTIIIGLSCNSNVNDQKETNTSAKTDTGAVFVVPDTSTIPHDQFGDMVRYGRELVLHTSKYLGPNGTVGHFLGNKMDCASCHIDGGTRAFGYNFFSAHARYPQYRGRENEILTLEERVNNCIERPHSGTPMPLDSKEMVAIVSYMKWLGANVPVGGHVKGDEALDMKYPDRAADPQKGAAIYAENCTSCHGKNGEGQWNADSSAYTYPPLWGPESFQKGSSPSRVVKLAKFIKANMPDKKAFWDKPFLTDDQALDVAAYINDDEIHPRPQKKNRAIPDYPNDTTKAFDYDKGPYADPFSETQHKYGPYKPIIEYHKAHHLPVID